MNPPGAFISYSNDSTMTENCLLGIYLDKGLKTRPDPQTFDLTLRLSTFGFLAFPNIRRVTLR